MQFRKIAAVAGTALMTTMSFAGAALAQVTTVADFTKLVSVTDNKVSFPLLVVGADAKPADVAVAIDLGVRLAGEAGATKEVKTSVAAAGVIQKDQIGLSSALNSQLPSLVKNVHFAGLKRDTYSWKGTDYSYSEQISLGSNILTNHDFNTNLINGTQKIVVPTNELLYEYVFDQALTGGLGSVATPNYSWPLDVKLMGIPFKIVGVGGSQVKLLSGVSGTISKTVGATYGDYTIYVTQAVNNDWVSVVIKDKAGNVVDTLSGITEGNSKDSDKAVLTIQNNDVRVSGTDPATQFIESDITVGPRGVVTKTLSTSCSTGGTGSSDVNFPGSTDWCMQVSGFGGTAGSIAVGDKLQVVYKPSSTQYLLAGQKLALPKAYAELGFKGFKTNDFVQVTVEPKASGGVSIYNNTGSNDILSGTFAGFEISGTPSGSIVDPITGTAYSKVLIAYNATFDANAVGGYTVAAVAGAPTALNGVNMHRPNVGNVFVAFWDATKNKYLANVCLISTSCQSLLNNSAGNVYFRALSQNTSQFNLLGTANGSTVNDLGNYFFNFTLNLSYGGSTAAAQQHVLSFNTTVANRTNYSLGPSANNYVPNIVGMFSVGTGQFGTSNPVQFTYQNKTTWTATGSAPEFRLGASASSAEATDIYSNSTPTSGSAAIATLGTATQDVVTDSGLIVVTPSTYAAADKVVFKVPSETQYVVAYVGKPEGSISSTTYKEAIPVATDVAKLDTEVTAADKAASNLVIVGGPCVNRLTAELWKLTYPACGDKSTLSLDTAWVQVFKDAFATGKVAYVIAGWEAKDTDLAGLAVQAGKVTLAKDTAVVKGTKLDDVTVAEKTAATTTTAAVTTTTAAVTTTTVAA